MQKARFTEIERYLGNRYRDDRVPDLIEYLRGVMATHLEMTSEEMPLPTNLTEIVYFMRASQELEATPGPVGTRRYAERDALYNMMNYYRALGWIEGKAKNTYNYFRDHVVADPKKTADRGYFRRRENVRT